VGSLSNFQKMPKVNNHPTAKNSPNLVTLHASQSFAIVTFLNQITTKADLFRTHFKSKKLFWAGMVEGGVRL
jgi:hypothetical protein